MRFDASRPSLWIWPPMRFAVPVPVYTAGGSVLYTESRQVPAPPPTVIAAPPAAACARVTVILADGNGWWKTVTLPAQGAASIVELRGVLDAGINAGPLIVRDAAGRSFEIPARSGVRTLIVDRCPAGR
jgi:hypothetical protein